MPKRQQAPHPEAVSAFDDLTKRITKLERELRDVNGRLLDREDRLKNALEEMGRLRQQLVDAKNAGKVEAYETVVKAISDRVVSVGAGFPFGRGGHY